MPLDSDVSNADAHLHVEFYENKSQPDNPRPFVRIIIPGDKTSMIDQPVRDDHKRRFPRQWLHFQSLNADSQVIGTPLALWQRERPGEFTEGQLMELQILKFQTVEQIAQASDTQIMRLGMGAAGLRERARGFLSAKNAQLSGAELANNRSEIEALKEMVANLTRMQAAAPLAAAAKPKGKRGGWNKGKKKVSVNVQHDDAPIGAAGSQ